MTSSTKQMISAYCRKGRHWGCHAKAGAPRGALATRCDCPCGHGEVALESDLTRDELVAMLNERTQREFGMTRDEFISALDEGSLPDTPAVEEIALLVGTQSK